LVPHLAAFPSVGTAGIIYVALDTNKVYRWSGTVYVEISPSPGSTDAVPEGSINLYYTNARASAAAPVQSVASKTGAVTLTKSDVGLANVDNTSDINKPISTAQQAALDLKAPLASPVFTGNPTAPTPTAGDSDTSIATTAFVTAAIAAGGSGGIPDAPSDGKSYGRLNAAWSQVLPITGGTLTGAFGTNGARWDEYIDSQKRIAKVAADAGAAAIVSNHSEYGNAYTKARLIGAKREVGENHPFVVGADGVQRYFTVMTECATASKLRAGAK
jgi:hypothetical protein